MRVEVREILKGPHMQSLVGSHGTLVFTLIKWILTFDVTNLDF